MGPDRPLNPGLGVSPSRAAGLVLAMLLGTASLRAQAPGPKPDDPVGKLVVPRGQVFALRGDDGDPVDAQGRIEFYRVERAEKGRLRLRAPGLSGWAPIESVVPADEAVTYFTDQIRDKPDDPHNYTMRASVLHRVKNDLDAALRDYDAAVRLDPFAAYVYNNRGNAYMSRRELDRAIEDYSKALEIDPNNSIARANRGRARLSKREFDKAIVDFDAAVEADDRDVNALISRGDARRYRKDNVRAIEDYDRALAIDPKSVAARAGRGSALLATKAFARAVADFDEAIRLEPKLALLYNYRGDARHTMKDDDGALRDFDEAIRLDPKSPQSYLSRAQVWRARGELDRALVDNSEAVKLDPKSVAAFNDRGVARQDKKDYDGAIADFDEAIRLEPKYGLPHRNRAVVELIAGRDGAERDARATIECEGWFSESAVYSVLIGHFGARRSGQAAAAKQLLDDAFQRCDDTVWPYPVVRHLRHELDADALLALAVDDDKRTEAHCYIGLDDLLSGRPGPAREHFRWVKDRGTKSFMEYTIAVAELDRMAGASRP